MPEQQWPRALAGRPAIYRRSSRPPCKRCSAAGRCRCPWITAPTCIPWAWCCTKRWPAHGRQPTIRPSIGGTSRSAWGWPTSLPGAWRRRPASAIRYGRPGHRFAPAPGSSTAAWRAESQRARALAKMAAAPPARRGPGRHDGHRPRLGRGRGRARCRPPRSANG